MKRRILLLTAIGFSFTAAEAQLRAYAITGSEKGRVNWSEVRLLDAASGDVVETIYQPKNEVPRLNARTGKPIVIREQSTVNNGTWTPAPEIRVISKDHEKNQMVIVTRTVSYSKKTAVEDPFATSSAALAYDKKHDRLYYTPMGINELRYVDIKSKTTKVYYFEGESFGVLAHRGDVPNQVTRMVIAANGKGYALTNNADHLIQFETVRKPVVKDLGALIDDPANGKYSVHSSANFGGDMIADAQGKLWLVTANRRVYQIDPEAMVATYKGSIKGLPAGFSTNGAAVEKDGGNSMIVCSSTSTSGYFRVDLNTLQAEKASTADQVFNASDLANGFIAFSKKKKDEQQEQQPVKPTDAGATTAATNNVAEKKSVIGQEMVAGNVTVYPNPVTTGVTRVAFRDYVYGNYQVQVLDISGKLLSSQAVNINNRLQVEQINLPSYIAKGNYLVRIVGQDNKVSNTTPIIVQ